MNQFGLQAGEQALRFFLKGGRAMYTAIGRPQEGSNDWDTGIMINPDLRPDHWYHAFAIVNDIVVHFLDKARFSFTKLLQDHTADLGQNLIVPQPMQMPDLDDMELRIQNVDDLTVSSALRGEGVFLPKGINGELIDIGISARSSPELREHWRTLEPISCPGIDNVQTSVPSLSFFVDDFCTMIREAIAAGSVSPKLYKRFVRLNEVLAYRPQPGQLDPAFRHELMGHQTLVKQQLPQASAALDPSNRAVEQMSSGEMMLFWGLGALLESIHVIAPSPKWISALDQHLAQPAIFNAAEQAGAPMFAAINQDGQVPAAMASDVQELVTAQHFIAAAATCAADVYQQKVTQRGLSAGQTALNLLEHAIDQAAQANQGQYYATGILALDRHMTHVNLPAPADVSMAFGGVGEFYVRCARANWQAVANAIDQQLTPNLAGSPLQGGIEQDGDETMYVVRSVIPMQGVSSPTPALFIAHLEPPQGPEHAYTLDMVDGKPCASIRDLVRAFTHRSGLCDDFLLRSIGKKLAAFATDSVLGRQLEV